MIHHHGSPSPTTMPTTNTITIIHPNQTVETQSSATFLCFFRMDPNALSDSDDGGRRSRTSSRKSSSRKSSSRAVRTMPAKGSSRASRSSRNSRKASTRSTPSRNASSRARPTSSRNASRNRSRSRGGDDDDAPKRSRAGRARGGDSREAKIAEAERALANARTTADKLNARAQLERLKGGRGRRRTSQFSPMLTTLHPQPHTTTSPPRHHMLYTPHTVHTQYTTPYTLSNRFLPPLFFLQQQF